MNNVVLEIKKLTRCFGTFTAVDALTLSVNTGEIFGLLGSNGAGKTTAIKMLTTLLPSSSGAGCRFLDNIPVGICSAINWLCSTGSLCR
ncbi:ATP-binding cassette domain-containing protein [Pseudanabaena sp. UWO310]|uniref:ATP-binding cassette domain-containing protein n=1 Tax=Pseudanabaena sp. UWO310 TaxID=2480795 RepID=UPI001160938A|nr:ATP-binding cassette domain-containing protein [Pseudanabaena sp. UWO310]TYQ25239.1 ATP-binding cassette domain-containing protein [Pseudanabaena sp. UWO310]